MLRGRGAATERGVCPGRIGGTGVPHWGFAAGRRAQLLPSPSVPLPSGPFPLQGRHLWSVCHHRGRADSPGLWKTTFPPSLHSKREADQHRVKDPDHGLERFICKSLLKSQ